MHNNRMSNMEPPQTRDAGIKWLADRLDALAREIGTLKLAVQEDDLDEAGWEAAWRTYMRVGTAH